MQNARLYRTIHRCVCRTTNDYFQNKIFDLQGCLKEVVTPLPSNSNR